MLPWGGGGPTLQSGAVGEGQDQVCVTVSSLCAVVTGTMDINRDCSCGRAMDPDMALGSSPSHFDRQVPRCGPSSLLLDLPRCKKPLFAHSPCQEFHHALFTIMELKAQASPSCNLLLLGLERWLHCSKYLLPLQKT